MIQLGRHRVRGGGCVQYSYRNRSISPGQGPWEEGTVEFENSFESIDDIYEPYGTGIWPYKPVIKQKFTLDANHSAGEFTHRLDNSTRIQEVLDKTAYAGAVWKNNQGFDKVSCSAIFPYSIGIPSDIRNQMRTLWENSLSPKIKAELDLLVTLAEFGDIIKLVKGAATLGRKLAIFKSHDSIPRNLLKGLKFTASLSKDALTMDVGDAVIKASGVAAEQLLQYSFALRPLLNDLVGVLRGLLHFRKKLEDLLAGQDKVHTTHASLFGDSPWNDRSGGSECGRCSNCIAGTRYQHNYPWYTIYTNKTNVRYGLTVKYVYSLPGWVTGVEGGIRALFSSLGLSPGVDTIWELIPFSFVIDWFIPIGSLFAKLQIDPTPVKCRVVDVVTSARLGAQAELGASLVAPCLEGVHKLATATYSLYYRTVDPTVLDLGMPTFRWPNLFQLMLGAALARTGFRRWGRGT